MESISGSMSGHKSDTGSFSTLYLHTLHGRPLFWSPKAIFQRIVHQWSYNDENLVSAPSTCLWSTMVDVISSTLAHGSFIFLPGLPRTSQKFKHWSRYKLCVAFYRTLYGPFVLNTTIWAIPYFPLDFTCFLTTTRSPVWNSLVIFPLLCSSLCLIHLSDARMLHNYLCINRSGYAA